MTMNEKSQVYFGSSSGSIEKEQEIKLTAFNYITSNLDSTRKNISGSGSSSSDGYISDEMRSISASDLAIQADSKALSKCNFLSHLAKSNTDYDLAKELKVSLVEEEGEESFQVIWQKLSFQVNLNLVDKLINFALKPNKIWARKASQEEEKRVIFKNLNGSIKSGQISAILGASGAGKTSLLNAICGRADNYKGRVQLVGGGSRKMRLSLIPQKDYLMENLTVRENLLYASKILNTCRDFNHESNIMRVVKMLNLTKCFHSSISKLSGGEHKRVSIAQELLRQPDILILDEPTSGLDSLTCKNLIESLIQLCKASSPNMNQIAIVMTIHQPDIDVYQMFDHVYCMAGGGNVMYDGNPRNTMNVIRQHANLRGHNIESQIAENSNVITNPANLLIEIASGLYGLEPIERLAAFQRKQFEMNYGENRTSSLSSFDESTIIIGDNNMNGFCLERGKAVGGGGKLFFQGSFEKMREIDRTPNYSNSSSLSSINQDLSEEEKSVSDKRKLRESFIRDKRLQSKPNHGGKFWIHTKILTKRAFTATVRDPLVTVIALLFHLSIPFVMWTVYSPAIGTVKACPQVQRDLDLVSMIGNKTSNMLLRLTEELVVSIECSAMFFITTYCFSVCSLTVAALAFPMDMHVLLKEVRNGWYNVSAFVLAKSFASFLFEVLFPVVSIILIYILLGMPSGYLEWRLWAVALVMALISTLSYTQGLLFGTMCMDNVQSAVFLTSASSLPLVLLSGFTARIKQMPTFLQNLSWLSPYRYSSDAINIIRFGYGICPCERETEQYLSTHKATFSDIPSNMKPLFTYYLTNTANSYEITQTSGNLTNFDSSANTTLATATATTAGFIPGLSYDLMMNSFERNSTLAKMEANEIDLFGRLADLMARAFAFGEDVQSCKSLRSASLIKSGTPEDSSLPYLFLGLLSILIVFKILLFILVKYKIGSRL